MIFYRLFITVSLIFIFSSVCVYEYTLQTKLMKIRTVRNKINDMGGDARPIIYFGEGMVSDTDIQFITINDDLLKSGILDSVNVFPDLKGIRIDGAHIELESKINWGEIHRIKSLFFSDCILDQESVFKIVGIASEKRHLKFDDCVFTGHCEVLTPQPINKLTINSVDINAKSLCPLRAFNHIEELIFLVKNKKIPSVAPSISRSKCLENINTIHKVIVKSIVKTENNMKPRVPKILEMLIIKSDVDIVELHGFNTSEFDSFLESVKTPPESVLRIECN